MLELNSNTAPAWKKGTTLIVGDSILSGLKKSKMLQKGLIKVRTYPGVTIEQMKFFVVLHVEKKADTIIIHVGTNNAPTPVHMKCFMRYKAWEISFWNIYHLRELPSWHRYCLSIRPKQIILTKLLQNWLKNLT